MKKPKFWPKPIKTNYEFQEGESIETKVRRILESNEPITDGAPIIYTNRDDGVIPAYNIRTDKWDIAQAAMEAIHTSKREKNKVLGEAEASDSVKPSGNTENGKQTTATETNKESA